MNENMTLVTLPSEHNPAEASDSAPMPGERIEAEICALAGHLLAATCRFLDLIADYDESRAWAQWEMRSCAEWLSWTCSLAPGTAREHVLVGRALRSLPVIHREFAAGRMSYSKVRELTRIATPATEAGLAEMATPMTASQVERFTRAHRQATQDREEGPREPKRSLSWRFDPDTGELILSIHLPPADGAVVLQVLRAAVGDLDHPHEKPPELPADKWPEEFKVATTLAPAGNLPAADGPISATHTATITAATIQQATGERLDLHHAIWVALNNERNPRPNAERTFYNIPPLAAALFTRHAPADLGIERAHVIWYG